MGHSVERTFEADDEPLMKVYTPNPEPDLKPKL